KTHEKIKQAGDNIEAAARKSRTIEQKLRKVEELPATKEAILIEDNVSDVTSHPVDDDSVQ
ncbi:MAG: DNA recombination protein RmuC, partial [Candidatus Omnitrophica bacterium]|nr:DNA recombination protein RmuC [Candidatus Omnitrophota bacterium]